MTTKQKFLAGALAVAAAVGTYLYIGQPTGYKGFYDNQLSSYFGNVALEEAQLAWHVKNGDNAISQYGYDSKVTSTSNWPKMARYIKSARKKGIKTFGVPYSNTKCLPHIEAYNKAQPNDSSRINMVKSEIEPYNSSNKDSAYKAFYKTIAEVDTWAQKVGKMETAVYMGWPTPECWDSIITHTDRLFLHAYVQPSTMTGAGIRGYTKSRTGVIANIVNAKYASNTSFKYNIVVIFSTEPSFSYSYFQNNTWDKPFADFSSYFNSYATTTEKNRIRWGGRCVFVSSYGKQARP